MTTSADNWTTVTTHDGGTMPAFIARPASGGGPGLVLLQEIFGVTEYIQSRARDLANLGYVVLVPELYWRIGTAHLHRRNDRDRPPERLWPFPETGCARRDRRRCRGTRVAERYARNRRTGRVIGFCLGGLLAYAVGTNSTPECRRFVLRFGHRRPTRRCL